MKLICPNCGAQYQIDADVIPEAGRDVQCSNCGHTWFERPGASEAAEEGFGAMETLAEPEVETVSAATTPVPSDDDLEDALGDEAPTEFARKPLDSSVADILKAEAEREQAARVAEAPAIETQQEMPVAEPVVETPPAPPVTEKPVIEEPPVVERTPVVEEPIIDETPDVNVDVDSDAELAETQSRIARLRGEEANIAAVAAAAASSRKELLPDIEEINSTLRSSAERGEVPEPMPEQVEKTKKRGFRFGFILGLLLIVALVLLYVFADQIIAAVPALEGAISGYVAMVDNFRLWLDGLIRGATDSIEPASDASN